MQKQTVGLRSNRVRNPWPEAEQRLPPRETIDPHSQTNKPRDLDTPTDRPYDAQRSLA
jgi:hypothetical protein